MPTLQDSLVSSSARPLTLRARPDLSARKHVYQGRSFWVVKEPLSLRYFRLEEEEYELLTLLDGRQSLDELQAQLEERFPPRKFALNDLQHWIGTLHQQGLLLSQGPGQGLQLQQRAGKKRREAILNVLGNLLAIRFRGIDPERLLTWLHPKLRWIFTPWTVLCAITLMAAALTLVLTNFDVFRARLPEFHEFFGPSNWLILASALALTKVIHEFGHGLTCKHYGGECHEMGLLLLVLTPCLYCNVSDSWLLRNKWHRAAIGAGGMFVELIIASLATFAWWFSEPGVLHELCLGIMFVCSVSTLIFNGNPLLRYDGYYILSDILEIPNLRQKSSTILRRIVSRLCLGLEQPDDPFLPRQKQVWFAIYSIASFIYGWVVVLGIIWFLNKALEPYGLKIIGQLFAAMAVFGLFIQPLWMLWQFIVVPGRVEKVKKTNFRISLALFAAAAAIIALVPFPHHVVCTLEIKPRDAEPVYVSVPGRLDQVSVRPGQHVEKGQPLAKLSNLDLEVIVAELRGKQEEYSKRLDSLSYLRSRNPKAGEEMASVRESYDAIGKQLAEKEHDLELMTLVAPVSGTVLAAPAVPAAPDAEERLPAWSGTPFDARNQHAWLEERELFCHVGNPHSMEADLVIDQADIEFVQKGQSVVVKLDQLPSESFASSIVQVAQLDLKLTPKQLSQKSGGDIVTKTDASGRERPQNTSYQASVPLDDPAAMLRPGLRGQARIDVGWQSLGSKAWRYLSQTFHFKW